MCIRDRCLNLKNGNNVNLQELEIDNNFSLSCIEVDDSAFSTNNWIGNISMDTNHYFSNNCSYTSNCFDPTIIHKSFQSINVFPNPTNSNISILINNYNGELLTKLYDITGKLLNTSNNNFLNLSEYPKGIYLIKVAYLDRVEDFKIIKE